MLAAALVVAIAVLVTPILVVNAFRVLATGTFVRAELGRDGFPVDRYGFTTDQRKQLALLGLRSIPKPSDVRTTSIGPAGRHESSTGAARSGRERGSGSCSSCSSPCASSSL